MTNDLDGWRSQINELDRQLLKTLEARFQVVERIAAYKKEHGLPVRDEQREAALIEMLSRETSLSPDFLKGLYSAIFAYSYLIEQ
jgi:chorismate mutase